MKIVVVGGGTAGWIAALMISKFHSGIHNVTLIESSAIGTIGVGEASTGLLRGVVNNEIWNFGLNEIDFIKYTNATPKLGIYYKGWGINRQSYMEPIDNCRNYNNRWANPLLNYFVANEIPMHLSSVNGRLLENSECSFFIGDSGRPVGINRHGYTFDAKLAADYFKSVVEKDIQRIDGKITDIFFKENGFVESVIVDNEIVVSGDFFIDASGTNRIFADRMEVKWKPYTDLAVNSALPFLLDHTDETRTSFYSTSIAMNNGWMWMNPKLDKLASGYVYNSNYISQDEAKDEVEKTIGQEIFPIKNLNFEAGRLDSFWNKNVLSIGLASSFVEPLEATSIHKTITQLHSFVFTHLKSTMAETMNEGSIRIYNRNFSKLLDNFRDFILIHYANGRSDNDFWRTINKNALSNENVANIISISSTRLLDDTDVEFILGGADAEMFNWVIVGLGHYSKETAIKELPFIKKTGLAEIYENEIMQTLSSYDFLSNESFIKLIEEKQ